MKRKHTRLAVVLAAVLPACFVAAQSPIKNFVAGMRDAHLVAPPQVAVSARVSWSSWSPDSRVLLAMQTDETAQWTARFSAVAAGRQAESEPVSTPSLVAWSRTSKKVLPVYRFTAAKAVVSQVEWIEGSSVALVNVSEESKTSEKDQIVKQTLLRVPMSGEPVTVLAQEVNTPTTRLAIAIANAPGKGPSYVLQRGTMRPNALTNVLFQSTVTPIHPDGTLGKPIPVPEGYVAGGMYYDMQGRPWVRLRATLDTPASPDNRGTWAVLNVHAGTMKVAENNGILVKAPETAEDPNITIHLVAGSAKLTQGRTGTGIAPLWLASEKEGMNQYALLCADAKLGLLSPTGDAVSYVSQGALFVREIVKAPVTLVQASIAESEKLQAMAQAKQCGLALMMLAADFEDTLPAASDYSASKLEPYMKNPSDLAGFVYTFQGARLEDIMDRAKTEIGYVKTESGRAVVFADSHAEWMVNVPPSN